METKKNSFEKYFEASKVGSGLFDPKTEIQKMSNAYKKMVDDVNDSIKQFKHLEDMDEKRLMNNFLLERRIQERSIKEPIVHKTYHYHGNITNNNGSMAIGSEVVSQFQQTVLTPDTKNKNPKIFGTILAAGFKLGFGWLLKHLSFLFESLRLFFHKN